jgi:hypothetical protein
MKITYREENGIFYPNLELPEQTNYPIGKYGRMRLDFIQKHRRGTYTTILTEGRLNEYLHEIDEQAAELMESAITRLADERGITEELKAMEPMRWVQEMNNAKYCAEEIVLNEIVYR